MHDDEETLTLGADHYLRRLVDRKTVVDHFWTGIRTTCLALALVLSIYSIFKVNSLSGMSGQEYQDFSQMKAELLRDELRTGDQMDLIKRLNVSMTDLESRLKGRQYPPPVMFDCYRTSRLSQPKVVTYHGCFVDTTKGAMNINSGVFKVAEDGIYQLSFTAKYVSSSKGRFGAWSDIFVNNTVVADSQREYNGNEHSNSESSTHSILVLYPLHEHDLVKVQFNKDGNSYIHSDNDHDVHFIGRKVAELP